MKHSLKLRFSLLALVMIPLLNAQGTYYPDYHYDYESQVAARGGGGREGGAGREGGREGNRGGDRGFDQGHQDMNAYSHGFQRGNAYGENQGGGAVVVPTTPAYPYNAPQYPSQYNYPQQGQTNMPGQPMNHP